MANGFHNMKLIVSSIQKKFVNQNGDYGLLTGSNE